MKAEHIALLLQGIGVAIALAVVMWGAIWLATL